MARSRACRRRSLRRICPDGRHGALLGNLALQLLLFVLGICTFVVAAIVVGTMTHDDAVGDSYNHGEPDDDDNLESQEQSKEAETDFLVEADNAIWIGPALHCVGENIVSKGN